MGLLGAAGLSDYCASKYAVCGFHDSCEHLSRQMFLLLRSHFCFAVRMELWHDGFKDDIHTLLVCPNGVDTEMFQGIFKSNAWTVAISQFLLPISSTQEAAFRIYRAMANRESLVISCYTGWRGWVVPWLPAITRLFPPTIVDWVVYVAGGVHGMDSFIGKKKL